MFNIVHKDGDKYLYHNLNGSKISFYIFCISISSTYNQNKEYFYNNLRKIACASSIQTGNESTESIGLIYVLSIFINEYLQTLL